MVEYMLEVFDNWQKVNLEVDLMAKYAEKLLKVKNDDSISQQSSVINSQWLNEQGWN